MSTKKSLIALAAMALALMGFASSAMAGTGKVVDVNAPNNPIPAGEVIHFVGWAQFATTPGTFKCHVTSKMTTTGTEGKTAHVNVFTIPTTANCAGTGALNGCTLTEHSNNTEGATHWDVTATPTDLDVLPVSGSVIDVFNKYSGCLVRTATVTFSEITLKPLNTEHPRAVTNTAGRLGDTITATNEQKIAGVEISGTGIAHIIDFTGSETTETATATGELEISEAARRCTYKLVTA